MTTTKKHTVIFNIDQEPKSKGGRRFQESENSIDGIDEVLGRVYLQQNASQALGINGAFKVTIEPV